MLRDLSQTIFLTNTLNIYSNMIGAIKQDTSSPPAGWNGMIIQPGELVILWPLFSNPYDSVAK